ncbi:hypothetical protein [Alteribacter salitolerans]|nr:hypothetical protein [Alteribacter salitolerans]
MNKRTNSMNNSTKVMNNCLNRQNAPPREDHCLFFEQLIAADA